MMRSNFKGRPDDAIRMPEELEAQIRKYCWFFCCRVSISSLSGHSICGLLSSEGSHEATFPEPNCIVVTFVKQLKRATQFMSIMSVTFLAVTEIEIAS